MYKNTQESMLHEESTLLSTKAPMHDFADISCSPCCLLSKPRNKIQQKSLMSGKGKSPIQTSLNTYNSQVLAPPVRQDIYTRVKHTYNSRDVEGGKHGALLRHTPAFLNAAWGG